MPIKAMVVDDTILYRKITSDALSDFKEIGEVLTAPSGDLALRKMALSPVDLVLCDINMPGLSGVETLVEIRKKYPKTQVVMMSGISARNAEVTVEALQKGAIDFIKKPSGASMVENMAQLKKDIENVLRLVKIKIGFKESAFNASSQKVGTVVTTPKPARVVPPPPVRASAIPKSFGVLAIGVSTGGPEALNNLIPKIPANLPVPVVLVQHMPKGFTKSLADSLNRKSPLNVVEATEGEEVKVGTVYIAPGGVHMTVRANGGKVVIGTNDGPPENSCKPAVDVLFRSVSAVYGKDGVASIILTGMGADGMRGVRVLKKKGCYSITQSEKTCVVYGMPKSVDDAGLSDKSLDINDIPTEIKRIFKI